MPIRRLAFLVLFLVPLAATAQVDEPAPLVVMNLAAHPDDEDGSTLTYYRHAKDAVAYSVLFTRGEGGQNEAGPELYERLGAIRTEETERAARILGTQVYYLNFYDFGFSKHAAETFREWSRPRHGFWDTDVPPVSEEAGCDTVMARLVYLIRRLKPDVLFTNHDTTTAWPNAQHGHHQVVGISAWEAFEKAADPAYHPEQLAEDGVDLWQPSRLFVRQRGDGAHDAAVPVGEDCGSFPRTPEGFVEWVEFTCADLAVEAAAQHVSQGFDKFADRFRRDTTYFVLYRSAPGVPPLPEGATDLAAGLPPNPHAAEASLDYLIASGRSQSVAYSDLVGVWPHPFRAEAWRGQITVSSPGTSVEVFYDGPDFHHPPAGQPASRWDGFDLRLRTFGAIDTTVDKGAGMSNPVLRISPDAPPTLPAFRQQYDRLLSSPPAGYWVDELGIDTTRYFAYSDGDLQATGGFQSGGGFLPLEVAPPVMVDLDPAPIRLVAGENEVPVPVETHDPAIEQVALSLSIVAEEDATEIVHRERRTLSRSDTKAAFRFTLPEDVPAGRYRVVVEAEAAPTSAPAEPYVEMRPAAVLPDVSVAEGLRVGFVRSYDRVTEDALRAMGAEVVMLDSTALAAGAFDGLDTIVLDIRAYLVRPDLRAHNGRLLDWVQQGGHLVVGYHKTFEWNPGQNTGGFFDAVIEVPDEGFAPYPLRLGRDRVTMEDAPVEVLAPEHALFNDPHAITEADWEGWVQERGLYFPSDYDARYQELVATGDPGEEPLRGGLLLAEVGEGTYLYSPLVFYRQLEALNPGAWRLFANLVSLPLTEGTGE